jgi:hypothetical protein
MEPPGVDRFDQSERHRRDRRVAVPLDVHRHPFRSKTHPLGHGPHDASVRLMRHEEVDLLGAMGEEQSWASLHSTSRQIIIVKNFEAAQGATWPKQRDGVVPSS